MVHFHNVMHFRLHKDQFIMLNLVNTNHGSRYAMFYESEYTVHCKVVKA